MSTPTDIDGEDFVPVSGVQVTPLLREVAAGLLLILGLAGAVVVALNVPWQVNIAALSLTFIAAGAALGMTR